MLMLFSIFACSDDNKSTNLDSSQITDSTIASDNSIVSDTVALNDSIIANDTTSTPDAATIDQGTVSDGSANLQCTQKCLDESPRSCVEKIPGHCVECIVDDHCQINPNALGPKCNQNVQLCYCSGETDCATNINGLVCDAINKFCGCTEDSHCPTGKKCNQQLFGLGQICGDPCTKDDDCASSFLRYFCDTTSGNCVECNIDADCVSSGLGTICTNQKCEDE